MKVFFIWITLILTMVSQTSNADEVEVRPPSSVSPPPSINAGTLRVSGGPGAHQRDSFVLFKCDKSVRLTDLDPSQNQRSLVEGPACHRMKNGDQYFFDLNSDHKLAGGIYLVRYHSDWGKLVEVKPGEQTEIKLRRIHLKTEDKDIVARFFVDLSSEELRHKWFVNVGIISAGDKSTFDEWRSIHGHNDRVESGAVMSPKRYCELYETPFFDRGLLSFFRFDLTDEKPIASVYIARALGPRVIWSSEEFINAHLSTATGVGDRFVSIGEFVAVLPGVYGVEYYHKITGEKAYQLGVVIE